MVPYSYKSFNANDLKDANVWSNEELNKFDNIRLSHILTNQKYNLFNNYEEIYNAVLEATGDYIPAILKDLSVKDTCKIYNNKYNFLFTYSLSDRNNASEEDTRVLECGIYEYTDNKSINNNTIENSKFILNYKIKLQHILSARNNFRNYINTIRMLLANKKDDKINTYVIPIYIFTYRDNINNPKYIRFSDYVINDDLTYIHNLLELIIKSLNRYIFANTYIWYNLNNRNSYYITNHKVDKEIVNRSSLIDRAKTNKNIIIYLDSIYNIPLSINSHKKNIYSKSGKLCSLSNYKFQVIGHYQHYWIGKGRKTRIKKWIDPYYKNEDKQFNIVKQYKEKELPED